MSVLYQDRWIECTDDAVRIKGYYFPWGTKKVPYASIRQVRRVQMGLLSGKGRIWGTGSFKYWASLDPRRPSKKFALVLETGALVLPFITPDDPAAVVAAITGHGDAAVVDGSVAFI